jgi:hypothetical protein
MSFQKTILALTMTAAFGAMAQTAPAAPESSLTYNLGVFSEYRYRGIAQTAKKPALQGDLIMQTRAVLMLVLGRPTSTGSTTLIQRAKPKDLSRLTSTVATKAI